MTLKVQKYEEDFPRGGTSGKTISKKSSFSFGRKVSDQQQKKKLGRRERKRKAASSLEFEIDVVDDVKFSRVEPLIYNTLSEGTLTLCSVREIYNKYVDICLPGRLSARLYIENTSEPYYESLESQGSESVMPLQNLFHIGQHLCCSVLSVKNVGHFLVKVSTNPKDVNQHITFHDVGVGSLLQMAVQSCEDHGYMMYSGITGLTSFLPAENAKSFINGLRNFRPLVVGEVVWCVVTKSKLTESSNIVHVSIDLNIVQKNKLAQDIKMEKLNPGSRVEVTINKIVSQNLMVTINGTDIQGYIEPSHLSSMWSKPNDYTIGSKHVATVLYKFPYPRVVALSLLCNPVTISKEEIAHGTKFERAEIMAVMKRGIAVKLESNGNIYKGVISIRRLGPNVEYVKLAEMFPLGNHITCRVIGYDPLGQVYSCSTEDDVLNEKYLSPNDLKIGEVVNVKVESLQKGGFEVSLGRIKGFVPLVHVADVLLQNPLDKVGIMSQQKAKVLNIKNKNVTFTLRPTLVKTRSLLSFENVSIGEHYFGTVVDVKQNYISVSFFGDLFTRITETNLIEPPNKYNIGELVKCYVVNIDPQKNNPVFSLVKSVQSIDLTVGKTYDIRVKQILKNGLECLVMVQNRSLNGFLPLEHMSDYVELCELIMKKYSYYSIIKKAVLFSVTDQINTFSIRNSVATFFEENPEILDGFNKLKVNMLLPASVSEIMSDKIMVSVPIPGFNAKVPIKSESLPHNPYDYDLFQGLVVKVTKLKTASVEIGLTCKLSNKENTEWSISNVENFLRTVEPLQCVKMGTEIECTIQKVKGNFVEVTTPFNVVGILRSPSLKKQSFKKGEKIKALVIFHDFSNNRIYLLGPDDAQKMNGTLQTQLLNKQFRGTVLWGNSVFIITMVHSPKGDQLAFIPTKENPNVSNMINIDEIVPYSFCNVLFKSARTSEKINYWIGAASSFQTQEILLTATENVNAIENATENISAPSTKKEKKKKNNDQTEEKNSPSHDMEITSIEKEKPMKKKRKNQVMENADENEDSAKKQKTNAKSNSSLSLENDKEEKIGHIKSSKERKSINSPVVSAKPSKHSEANKNGILTLEDVGEFKWDATPADLAKAVSGNMECEEDGDISQDSDEEKLPPKKMTPAEKRAAAIEAERKIRLKEDELLQAEKNPQTPEHFERLLLGHPNSSKFWIMYMAHHLEATEVEKARAVAKRAIKQINVRFEEERLNVWISRLNLEHFYGTPELFKEVLNEALKYNDEYEVFRRVLDIYAQSKNTTELESLSNMLVKKHKEKVDCWLQCQEALMKAEMYDKARNYLQRSLNVLPIKDHCTLISRFALIENKYGFPDQSQALFENLLTSYPKRVDLWSVYIDMLVKSGSVDLARNVLERATSHTLPVRKMKALYQKWLKFEEDHGTPETVQKVKDAANEYVNNLTDTLKQP